MTRNEVHELALQAFEAFKATHEWDGKVATVHDRDGFQRLSSRHRTLCAILQDAEAVRQALRDCGVYEGGEVE
jgi:hypothetical protein